jgi:hypothetical protein
MLKYQDYKIKIKVGKLTKIKKLLFSLYILPEKEINAFAKKCTNLPEKGLEEIIQQLEKAYTERDKVIEKIMYKDRTFLNKLKKFTKEQERLAANMDAASDKNKAEQLITKIK